MSHRIFRWGAFALLLALPACVGPSDRRPGLALHGVAVENFPEDWSFTDAHREIAIQVRTPYLLPHSVTVWCAALDGKLYLGARNPEEKRWAGWVDDDRDVRLRIAGEVYAVRLAPVSDEAAVPGIRRAYGAKYGLPATRPEDAPPVRYWLVTPRAD